MAQIVSIMTDTDDGSREIALLDGKKYKILPQDYINLPFEPETGIELADCRKKEPLPDTRLNEYYNGENSAFLRFLSNRRIIYSAALAKIAAADMPKRKFEKRLYEAFLPKAEKAGIDYASLKLFCAVAADEFEEKGYINDYEYAKKKTVQLREVKFYGKSKIKNELYLCGISGETADELLSAEVFDENSAENHAYMKKLLDKKYRGVRFEDRNAKSKAAAYLARNGYKFGEAAKAVVMYGEEVL